MKRRVGIIWRVAAVGAFLVSGGLLFLYWWCSTHEGEAVTLGPVVSVSLHRENFYFRFEFAGRVYTLIGGAIGLMLLSGFVAGCAWWKCGGAARRQRQALAQGLCSNCGYDCRVTPERCPECGIGRSDP